MPVAGFVLLLRFVTLCYALLRFVTLGHSCSEVGLIGYGTRRPPGKLSCRSACLDEPSRGTGGCFTFKAGSFALESTQSL